MGKGGEAVMAHKAAPQQQSALELDSERTSAEKADMPETQVGVDVDRAVSSSPHARQC